MIDDKQNEWDKYLDSVLFACCTSKQMSIKFSPFFFVSSKVWIVIILLYKISCFFITLQAENESEINDEVDAVPVKLSSHVEKFIELRKNLDTEVKAQDKVAFLKA